MDAVSEEVSAEPGDVVAQDVIAALPSLLGLAVALTGDLPSAEDLVNTAVVRLFADDRAVRSVKH